MSIYVISQARFELCDLSESSKKSDLRKATLNMLMAHATINKLIKPLALHVNNFDHEMAVVLGTGHGEMSSTKDFLKYYRIQNVARPILFQNSLHNSTLGFLSQLFKFKGPAITNSDRYFTGEKSLEIAQLLLDQKLVSYCLVIGVDSLVQELDNPFRLIYPECVNIGQGCGAVLLSNEEGLNKLKIIPKAIIKSISYDLNKQHLPGIWFNDYYDSDAIEKLVIYLELNSKPHNLELQKPDGCKSCLALSSVEEVS